MTTGEIVEALWEPLKLVVETGPRVLEKTPPELVADIIDRGVALCGGAVAISRDGIQMVDTSELLSWMKEDTCRWIKGM